MFLPPYLSGDYKGFRICVRNQGPRSNIQLLLHHSISVDLVIPYSMSQHLFYIFVSLAFHAEYWGTPSALIFKLLMLFSCISLVLSPICKIVFSLEILFNSFSTDTGHFGKPSTMFIKFIFCLFKLLHTDLLYILYLIISFSLKDGLNKFLSLIFLPW